MQGKNYIIIFKKNDLDLQDIEFLNNTDMMKAVVRGAFLGSGSLTEPNSRYHLEIRLREEKRKK